MRTTAIQRTEAVTEEVTSPELVLVAPPEIAAQAREALPDYESDVLSALHSRLAAGTEVAVPEEAPERERIGGKPQLTFREPLPSYESESKGAWYEVVPKPVGEPRKRLSIRVITLALLAMVLLPVALVLLIRYI